MSENLILLIYFYVQVVPNLFLKLSFYVLIRTAININSQNTHSILHIAHKTLLNVKNNIFFNIELFLCTSVLKYKNFNKNKNKWNYQCINLLTIRLTFVNFY